MCETEIRDFYYYFYSGLCTTQPSISPVNEDRKWGVTLNLSYLPLPLFSWMRKSWHETHTRISPKTFTAGGKNNKRGNQKRYVEEEEEKTIEMKCKERVCAFRMGKGNPYAYPRELNFASSSFAYVKLMEYYSTNKTFLVLYMRETTSLEKGLEMIKNAGNRNR